MPSSPPRRFFFPKSPFLDFETIRILGTATYGGADLGEVLEAVSHISEKDIPTTWHDAWSNQAERAESVAREALSLGHKPAARNAFLRASNYTRASGYMMAGEFESDNPSEKIVPILRKAAALFQEAIKLFDHPVHRLHIPYVHHDGREVELPGYLYLPPTTHQSTEKTGKKTPILVNFIGADSIPEEIHYMFPASLPYAGYAVLTVEGPGQGLTLFEKKIPMRPDWEVVSSSVLDYLSTYSEQHPEFKLDMDQIAVAGASLGGYLALRAAVSEARYKACVAIDPPLDMYQFAVQHSGPGASTFFGGWERGWIPDSVMNGVIGMGMYFSWQMRYEINSSSRMFGATSPADLLRAMKTYSFRPATLSLASGLKPSSGSGVASAPSLGSDPSPSTQGGPEQRKEESLLHSMTCSVFVTGAKDSLYFDVRNHTNAIADGLRRGRLRHAGDTYATMTVEDPLRRSRESSSGGGGDETVETWVGLTAGTGSLQAKMGALGFCNQNVLGFLDRHLGQDS